MKPIRRISMEKEVIKSEDQQEEGATLVEYALLVALIAVVCIAAITSLGGAVQKQFSDITTAIGG